MLTSNVKSLCIELIYKKHCGTLPYTGVDQEAEQSQVLLCKLSVLLVILWKGWAMLNIILRSQGRRYIQVHEEAGKLDWEPLMPLEWFVEEVNKSKQGEKGKFNLGCWNSQVFWNLSFLAGLYAVMIQILWQIYHKFILVERFSD